MADSNDTLVRVDPKSQELAYNNTTDRMKVELPLDTAGFGGHYSELAPNTVGNLVWQPAAGKKFIVTDFLFSAQTEGKLKVYTGGGNPSETLMTYVLASGASVQHTFATPYPGSAINTNLKADCNPGCSGYLAVWGYEL
jgi:hypothetical protein